MHAYERRPMTAADWKKALGMAAAAAAGTGIAVGVATLYGARLFLQRVRAGDPRAAEAPPRVAAGARALPGREG